MAVSVYSKREMRVGRTRNEYIQEVREEWELMHQKVELDVAQTEIMWVRTWHFQGFQNKSAQEATN